MRHIVASLLLALCPALLHGQCGPHGCVPPAAPPPPTVPQMLVAACVQVRCPRGEMGSGTVIHADATHRVGVVLTCKHVVGNERRFTLTFPDGRTCQGSRHQVDEHADLASILFDADDATQAATLAQASPQRGDRLYQVGYPGGRGPNVRFGAVAFYVPSIPVRSMVPTFVAKPGDSGSGVFLTADNALCGVVWGRDDRHGDQAQVVEWKDIRRFCAFLPQLCPPARPQPKPDPAEKIALAELTRKVEDLARSLQDMKAGSQRTQSDLQALRDKMREAESALLHLRGGGEQLRDDFARIQSAFERLGNAGGPSADVRAKLELLTNLARQVPELAAKLQAAESITGVAGLTGTLVAVGAATGGVGVPALLAGWAVLTLLRRRSHPPAQVVVRENAPPPQVIRHESTYVPYEAPSAELNAHKLAMDEVVKKYPGSRDTIEILKTFASQLLAGQKK